MDPATDCSTLAGQQERLLTRTEASAMLPRPVHKNTFKCWRTVGKRGHVLEAKFICGQWYYPVGAFLRFLELTSQRNSESVS
jgi:hypothetical protein